MLPFTACDPGWALQGAPPPAGKRRASTQLSNALVTGFYRKALVERQVRSAFETYVGPGFVEHKPDVATGDREGTISFLEGLIADVPQARWEVLRVVAAGDTVAVHARFTPAPGAPPYAVADFFRVADCRIVEHWDVVAGPAENPANRISRF
jgi:predicted SnoaL-like aldol condensation-catalyzing enzyme